MNVSLALAFAAGLLSFASPCVLALVPVYLAFLGEGAGAVAIGGPSAVATGIWRGPLIGEAMLFVIGFSTVFVGLGVSTRSSSHRGNSAADGTRYVVMLLVSRFPSSS